MNRLVIKHPPTSKVRCGTMRFLPPAAPVVLNLSPDSALRDKLHVGKY
jgi:hypothetical protein